MKLLRRTIASALIVSTALLGAPLSAQAGIVSSAEVLASQAPNDARIQINAALAREDVRAGLAQRGVSLEQAQARVQALSDDEAAALAGRIDQAPAGGDILGVAFTLFIILLITDILGLTKVFPFTRAVR